MTDVAQKLEDKITAAVAAQVASPTTNATAGDIRQIAEGVIDRIVPQILDATNNEPLWQSKVLIGSVTTVLSSAFAIIALVQSGSTDAGLYATPVVALAGAALAIYSRLTTIKKIV